jgi:tetratricopeptide (TPR) repeat protein
MKHLLFVLCLLLASSAILFAQPEAEAALAEKYYLDGEYDSALELFEKLNKREQTENFVLRIVSCYENLDRYPEALDFIDKSIRKEKEAVMFYLVKANLLEKTGDLKNADKLYQEVIQEMLRTEGDFTRIGSFLYKSDRLELARQTYSQGRKRMKDPYSFSNELANIFQRQGEYESATQEYLNDYFAMPPNLNTANLDILNMVNADSKDAIEGVLLQNIDLYPNDLGLRTILFEFYVLAEDFYEAFIQVKAIDKFFQEDGNRVYRFAETMRNNKNYELSNKAYDYIIEKKASSPFFYLAHMEKAVNGELRAFDQIPVDESAINEAINSYGALLDQFGRNPQYFDAIYRRARLMVFYKFDLENAKAELDAIQPRLTNRDQWAQATLLIGDIQLMQKEYNKAKLTYTEVSEQFKDRQIGALAKFKLAQLSYFKGEFETSQAMLSAIKDNTSNDISNDAIKLNLIIMDNTGLDSTTDALSLFAQAQLKVYQRDYDPAMEMLDSLAYRFPTHPLSDEILWEKANIFLKRGDIPTALDLIERILKDFKEDIYGDDALYTKARIHDYTLKDPETAMQFYMEFLATFPGSLYSVEVRKRVRELRKEG